jgi:hypothetical protein
VEGGCDARVKVAFTLLAESIVTRHSPVPEQAPDQRTNLEPGAAPCVTPTWAPALYLPVADPGLAVSDPDPSPSFDKVNWYCPGGAVAVKLAVTLLGPSISTMQGLLAPQVFDQPLNCEPGFGVAVSDTDVPWLNVPPEGLTFPDPVPDIDIVSEYCFKVNVAVTVFGPSIVTLQVLPLGVQPDQLVNTELAAGAAVSVTGVPWLYVPLRGVTVPDPFPPIDTVNVYCLRVKVAVTVLAASIVTVQVLPLGVQPDQLVN